METDLWGNTLTDEEKAEYTAQVEKVDWTLPEMEKVSESNRLLLTRLICDGTIVNSIRSMGWAFWPTKNKGYYDPWLLRLIADFTEAQNKPFWDEYEKWSEENELREDCDCEDEDEICLDELGFTATPTSTTETSASSSVNPESL